MSYLDLLQFHAFCLAETGSRLSEYARALAATVHDGDIVLDLGTGSGLLAFLACRAGAARVYAIESSDAIRLGELLAPAAGFAERIEFIQSASSELKLREQVDVIVADIHDTFGLQPGGLAALVDARDRLLKPAGTLVPRAIELLVAPVEAATFYAREIDVWTRDVQGVGLAPIRPFAVNHVHAGRFDRKDLLSSPTSLCTIDLAHLQQVRVSGTAVARIERDGVVHGLCGCFITTLAGDIRMSNVPGDSGTTNFAQAFFPFERPVSVAAGDECHITIDSHDGQVVRWRAEISRAGQPAITRFDQSTLSGMLVSPQSLHSHAQRVTVSSMSQPIPNRLQVHPSVLSRELGGETVLLNLESGVYYGLDAVGTRAWNLLIQERSLADVCAIMVEEYDVPRETLESDITTLVRDLCEKQILVERTPAVS